VWRNAAFTVPLDPRDFPRPAGRRNDAMPRAPNRIADCTAASSLAERDPPFQLLRDVFGDQVASISGLRISTMFSDTSALAILPSSSSELDVLALLADHDARPPA